MVPQRALIQKEGQDEKCVNRQHLFVLFTKISLRIQEIQVLSGTS